MQVCVNSVQDWVDWVSNSALQWGAADAEIKTPSGENTELKRSPFEAWSRSVYSHTCYADFFLANFFPSSPMACIFSKTSRLSFSC